jgi:hypothetical protein
MKGNPVDCQTDDILRILASCLYPWGVRTSGHIGEIESPFPQVGHGTPQVRDAGARRDSRRDGNYEEFISFRNWSAISTTVFQSAKI